MSFFLYILLCATSASAYVYINLGSAATYGALSFSAITNTGPTTIQGDIGTTGTSITGFPPGVFTGGEFIASQATTPLNDAKAAYNAVAALSGGTVLTGNLGGRTLVPGTYIFSSSAELSGTLTLAGTGSPYDAWYFQIGSTLTTSAGSAVTLTGGGLPCNVYWQVGTSATLGTGSAFYGTLLAQVSVTLDTAATSDGGVFALGGTLTMDTNTVDAEYCVMVSSPSSTAAATTVLSASSSTSTSEFVSSSTTSISLTSTSSSASSTLTTLPSGAASTSSSSSTISTSSAAPSTTSSSSGTSLQSSSPTLSSSSSSSYLQSSSTSTLPPAILTAPPICIGNNCLNELRDARFSASASTFCKTYTTTINTQPSAIPTYLENCYLSPEAVSSACTCLLYTSGATTSSTFSLSSSSKSSSSKASSTSSGICSISVTVFSTSVLTVPKTTTSTIFSTSTKTSTSVTTSTSIIRSTSTIVVTKTTSVPGCTIVPKRSIDEGLEFVANEEAELGVRNSRTAQDRN